MSCIPGPVSLGYDTFLKTSSTSMRERDDSIEIIVMVCADA